MLHILQLITILSPDANYKPSVAHESPITALCVTFMLYFAYLRICLRREHFANVTDTGLKATIRRNPLTN